MLLLRRVRVAARIALLLRVSTPLMCRCLATLRRHETPNNDDRATSPRDYSTTNVDSNQIELHNNNPQINTKHTTNAQHDSTLTRISVNERHIGHGHHTGARRQQARIVASLVVALRQVNIGRITVVVVQSQQFLSSFTHLCHNNFCEFNVTHIRKEKLFTSRMAFSLFADNKVSALANNGANDDRLLKR